MKELRTDSCVVNFVLVTTVDGGLNFKGTMEFIYSCCFYANNVIEAKINLDFYEHICKVLSVGCRENTIIMNGKNDS